MAEDRLEVTHLMGKKLDKPIIIKWKAETKKNKMEAVAQLFGKRLGEEFKMRYLSNIIKTRFTEHGLEEHFLTSEWLLNGELLRMLLAGEVVIVDE